MARRATKLYDATDSSLQTSAHWIGGEHPFDLHEVYLNVRSPSFDRPDGEALALFITADSRYKLWINGDYVASGPARCWPDHQAVDRIEIGHLLQPEGNRLAVQVYQPGYSHFSYVHRGVAGLLAWLETNGQTVLVTDADWRTRRDPSYAAQVERVSIYGSGVEDIDLRLIEPWQDPSYEDSTWVPARVVSPSTTGLWNGLHERAVPMPVEQPRDMQLIEVRRAETVDTVDVHERLRAGWSNATPLAQPSESFMGSLTSHRSLAPSESLYCLYDLGRNYTCQASFEVENAVGNEEIVVSYAEKFRDGELVLSDPETYCRVRLTDRFQLRPGDQTVCGFTFRGGRYLLVQIVGPTNSALHIRPGVTIAKYPLEITKPLDLADPKLKAIVAMCETTMRACLQETFVDCCWRENSQWLGDALPQALIMASMCDDVRPLRQTLIMAAQGTYPDGVLPSILPGEVHAYAVVDYNFTWVEMLALYWTQTEDRTTVIDLWPTLVRLLDRFHGDLGNDGLIRSQPGRRLFLDWAPLSREEPNALYNFRYLYALQTAAHLAQSLTGRPNDRRRWEKRATALSAAIRSHFLRDDLWYDDLARSTHSQHATAFALLTGCAMEGEQAALLDALTARSLDLDDEPAPDKLVLASPFMHHYVFEALHKYGRDKETVEIIRQRWGRWVDLGSPTTWENWNVDFPDGSICHAFSAHPRYHLAVAAGAFDASG